MGKGKSKTQLEAELEHCRKHGIGSNVTRIFRDLIKYAALVAVSYFIYLTADTWAGKTTFADINVNTKTEIEINKSNQDTKKLVKLPDDTRTIIVWTIVLAWIFGIGGVIYGRWQAKLRKDHIVRFYPLIKQAQEIIDENRTSSGLTDRGETQPEIK